MRVDTYLVTRWDEVCVYRHRYLEEAGGMETFHFKQEFSFVLFIIKHLIVLQSQVLQILISDPFKSSVAH